MNNYFQGNGISLLVMCFYLLAQSAHGQVRYDRINFISPVKHKIKLSGSFGELRSHHFHTGIDIKSEHGTIGDPVYAADDGWISRIKVEAGGYGQAIYIDHPNGLRTVYGHLHSFIPKYKAIVLDSQYSYKSFHVDLHFPKGKLPVKQGQQIAEMGSKGYSYGPHLHFEIRNAINDVPYNPLSFGIPIEDSRTPVISDVEIGLMNSDYDIYKRIDVNFNRNGDNYAARGEISVPENIPFTITLHAYDRQEGTWNRNGIYQIQLWKNDSLIQYIIMDSIPYSVTHQEDAYIDYGKYLETGDRYHCVTQLPGMNLPIFIYGIPQYSYELKPGENAIFRLEVSDFLGNEVTAQMKLSASEQHDSYISKPFNYYVYYDSANLIKLNDFTLYLPEGSMYKNNRLYISTVYDKSGLYKSPVLQMHNKTALLNKAIKVKYRFSEDVNRKKATLFIGRCTDNAIVYLGSSWQGNTILGEAETMGNFAVLQDTTPPEIIVKGRDKNPSRGYEFVFEITDNIRGGELKIWAEMDGKWYLGEEIAKYSQFRVPVPDEKTGKEHQLVIYAVDVMGNENVKVIEFHY